MFRLKFIFGGTTYYVKNISQTILNRYKRGGAGIETSNITGLTTNIDESASFTAEEVKTAKIAYPDFVSEAYTPPAENGILSSASIWLGQSQNGTTNGIVEHTIVAENITTPTVAIQVTNESDPVNSFISVGPTNVGPFAAEVVLPVVGGSVNTSFWTQYHGVAGTGITSCDLVLKDGAGVVLFTAVGATGYRFP